MNKTPAKMHNRIMKQKTPRSQRAKGVRIYAEELLRELGVNYGGYTELEPSELYGKLLNGAKTRNEYSRGGCSLIYNYQIAERLCNKTELKRTKNGKLKPNKHEERLDVQTRALYQAEQLIAQAYWGD